MQSFNSEKVKTYQIAACLHLLGSILSELKAEEGPQNISDDRFVVRQDERYVISDITLKDAAEHVQYTFSVTRLRPFQQTRGHSHDESDEVYYIDRGTGVLMIGNKHYAIKGGDVMYVPPGVFHKLINSDGRELVAHSISPKNVKRPAFKESG